MSQNVNGTTTHYAYNDANQLCRKTTTAGACEVTPPATFDLNGNETAVSGVRSATYNAKDHTTAITPNGGSATTLSHADADQTKRVSRGGITSELLGPTSASPGCPPEAA